MSHASLFISEEHETENDNTIPVFHPLKEHPNHTLLFISPMFAKVQEINTNLNIEHHYEEHELIRLNKFLGSFVNFFQQLELQNTQYVAKLDAFRAQLSDIYSFGSERDQGHIHLEADFIAINHEKIGYEFEFELFQMQSEIYQYLMNIINQSSDEQRLKLQQELEQSSSILIGLRVSHEKLQQSIASLHAEREDIFQQYLKVANTWSHKKKHVNVLKIDVQALKNQHIFYKKVHSQVRENSFSVEVFDVKQFWASKWETTISNIRHDYELLYASIHRETVTYYEKKMEEVKEAKVEEIKYYRKEVEMKRLEIIQQTLRKEHEEAQKLYTNEKETLIKLETAQSKLESEFQSVQFHYGEKFEKQSKDLLNLQEMSIITIDSIEEMRRKKISMESELIIYRRLLEVYENSKKVVMNSDPLIRSTTMRTFVIERLEIASIGIECPLDSTYICLMNHSTSKDVDVSRWMLKRRIDSKTELKYTLPDETRLPAGGELRIYSRLGADAIPISSDNAVIYHPLHHRLVNNNVISWMIGDKIETHLFNEDGEEKASYIQSAASEETISD